MSEYSVLEITTREVVVQGKPLKVSPVKVGQLPGFARAIKPVFAALADLLRSVPSADGAGGGGEPKLEDFHLDLDAGKVLDIIEQHGDHLIDAAAVAVRVERSVIEDAAPDEFVALVRAIVEVNVDFFGRAVAKAIGEAQGPGAGQTASSS